MSTSYFFLLFLFFTRYSIHDIELSLLKEGKSIVETKLAEAIQKGIPDYYEVERGDSLWKIAKRFYNQGGKWIRIFEANIEKIKNPDLIYPYQRFTIPKE